MSKLELQSQDDMTKYCQFVDYNEFCCIFICLRFTLYQGGTPALNVLIAVELRGEQIRT